MQFNQLKPIHKQKIKRRVGRGGKRGTYSGKGMKGQSSRAGHKMQPAIRELIKKFPKLRGYRSEPIAKNIAVVNLEVLEKKFNEGEVISPEILLGKNIIRRIRGRLSQVKVLGKGDIKKKLVFKGLNFSKSAKEKIEKAGGEIIIPKSQ